MAWSMRAGERQIEFGGDLSGLGLMSTPRVRPVVEVESFGNPRGDGQRHGRMRRRGQVVSLDVEARPDHRPMADVWAELLSVWRADGIRFTPGARAVLMSDSGRVAYGMPVDIEPSEEYRIFDTNRAVLTFDCVDDLWYGPAETTRVRFSIPESGGLTFPAEAPFTFDSGPTQRNGVVVVGGEAPILPVFVVQGPVTNPSIHVTGVGELQLSVTLAYDQTLTVDCRNGWVMRDGSPLPGAVSPRGARLKDMALTPGSYEVVLRGYDPTGTGYLDVQVEPAFTTF